MQQTADLSLTEIIRDTLLTRLFKDQKEFWFNKLNILAGNNAQFHGELVGTINWFGIHYLGKNWRGNYSVPFLDFTFLTLHPEYPDLEKDLLVVVAELSELETEEYEANRFLSGLVLFPAPVRVFQKILGKQLFSECKQELEQYLINSRNFTWDANSQVAIATYVEQHDYILKAMNQRLLVNLITRDHNRQ
jgi:hypothetical protein